MALGPNQRFALQWKRTPQELASAIRTLHSSRGEALAYLTYRILLLERIKASSPRLPELRAAHREIEHNSRTYA